MDLAHPLRSLIPSLDSAVLDVLVGTESGLSASQIARLSRRGSRQGQATVLDRLVYHGLVVAEPANRGHLYRFNREHVLAPAVEIASAARGAVMSRLAGALETFDPLPVHASVFGSLARSEGSPQSDIDLLLVAGDGSDIDIWTDQIRELEDGVFVWTGNRLESLALTTDGLREAERRGEPLVASLLQDSIVVHGGPLADVIRRTRR